MKVLNFGSLNLDYVYDVDHIVMPGETITSNNMRIYAGGKGLNQSIALARAGIRVYHAGCVGEDGNPLLEACVNANVDTTYVKKLPEKSGHTIIQVDKAGQNSILLYPGTNRMITKEFISEVIRGFGEGDLLLLQNEINELPFLVDSAYAAGMKIILNPSPYDDLLKKVDASKISMFLINEIEGEQMTGVKSPTDILQVLKETYPYGEVVLTLGSQGAIYQKGEIKIAQEAQRVEVVDTTAAGDTFTGYFIAAMMEGMTPKEGLLLASQASAIAVTRNGASPSIPYRKELKE